MPIHPKRILVVEDDPDIRELIAEMLQMEGYVVAVAGDGAEGLERAHQLHPDVILLDLMMPVMNGWEFRAAQAQDPELADVPVVIVSASLPAGFAASAELAKPFEPVQLFATVERVAA